MIILILIVAAAGIIHIPMLKRGGCVNEIYVFSAMLLLCLVFGGLYLINTRLMSVSNTILSIFNQNI